MRNCPDLTKTFASLGWTALRTRRTAASLCALGLTLWANGAGANGGGYAFGVSFTGTIAPFQASGTEHVRILEETLDVSLRRADASVVVRYTMKNLAPEPVSVRFGFPVEASTDDLEEDEVAGESAPVRRRKNLARAIQQLKGYAVTAGGKPVESKFVIEPFASGALKPFPGSKALKGIAGWMVSTVTFPAGEPLPLEIRYAADYMGEATFVSFDVRSTPESFVYRLSTGAVWNGPIEKGTVTVHADGIAAEEVEFVEHLTPRQRFKRDGDRWTWSFQGLEPTLADDINIRALPGYYEVESYDQDEQKRGVRGWLERGRTWGRAHQRFKATASSTLPATKAHGFGPEHLAQPGDDWEARVPWAEGVDGAGIGEWVELKPTTPGPLLALRISTGFDATEKLFRANARPSRVEILLNGEHRFSASLGDARGGQLIPILGYSKPVTTVRITIREVHPGTRFEDTCIARVVLYDRLRKRPEMRGAR